MSATDAPSGTPFIPAALDDANLSATQFRVFARIARRSNQGQGRCTESIVSMAVGVHLEEKTVKAALKALRSRRMVRIEARIGGTNVIVPLPADHWLPAATQPRKLPHPNGTPRAERTRSVSLYRKGGQRWVARHGWSS